MKKIVFLAILLISFAYASIDVWDQIAEEDQLDSGQVEAVSGNQLNFKLERIKTDQQLEDILVEKIVENLDKVCGNFYSPVIFYGYRGGARVESLKGITPQAVEYSPSRTKITSLNYSKTNIQKQGVDEPDILKNLGKYVIYYNNKTHKVYIIENNLENIDNTKIIETIRVPSVVRDVKVFATHDRLVLMGTRFSKVGFVKPRTDILIFDISQLPKVKFLAFYDIKGDFFDARLIDNKLYVISTYDLNNILYRICNKRRYEPIRIMRKLPFSKEENIQKYMKEALKKHKDDIKKELEDVVKNKALYLYYSKDGKLKIKNRVYPFKVGAKDVKPQNIYYIPADFSKIDRLTFSVVGIFDIESPKDNFEQYFIWGNLRGGQIHMTKSSLYLVNNYYRSYRFSCPPGLYCIMPIIPRGDFTLIHKLKLEGFSLDYINTALVSGKPINQYSMDEDNQGFFRIFTKHFFPQRATDLYVFDKSLKLVGKLVNIAPGEEFKSSRFMEDKAFLVTFKATDPLFVIDLKDPKNPEIIGELKIPGYSLYLHPLYKFGSVRYLLGIGQEAKEVYGSRSLPRNIKIDVYEVDFSKKQDIDYGSGWKEVDFEIKTKPFGDGYIPSSGTKLYQVVNGQLIVSMSVNCCNEGIKVLTDGEGNYKILVIRKGPICKCIKPVNIIVSNVNEVKDVKIEYVDIEDIANKIFVKQLYTYILGEEKEYKNGGSYTPVFDNPRTFVIRYDSVIKDKATIYLPVYLTKDVVKQRCWRIRRCEPILKEDGSQTDEEICKWVEECRDYVSKEPYFIGVKGLEIYKDTGIKEVISKNFIDKIGKISQWEYKRQGHRVGYVNQYVFEINNLFYDIFDKVKEKFIWFSLK